MNANLDAPLQLKSGEGVSAHDYARCIAASKRVRWDIDDDVIRGRRFDLSHKFLPEGLSFVDELAFLSPEDRLWLSQIQGRTYANMFGLVERFIGAQVLEISREHWLGDQIALEALVRFSDEELKHQELFRRIEVLTAAAMPDGYAFDWNPNEIAGVVLSKSTWAVMGLTLHIELFTQAHFRESVAPDAKMSPLFKDVLTQHWREECQHAILDELEWRRVDKTLTAQQRDAAVTDLIDLVVAVDGIVQGQAKADADYFAATCQGDLSAGDRASVAAGVLKAYRWQYILSGAQHPHFLAVLMELITPDHARRIMTALATLS